MMRGPRNYGDRAFLWFASVPDDRELEPHSNSIGVDLGLASFVVGIKLVRARYVS
jgi:hypothetical protein